MLGKLIRRLWNAMSCEIAGRSDDNHPHRAKLPRNELGAFERPAAQRDIGSLFDKVDYLIRQGYLQ